MHKKKRILTALSIASVTAFLLGGCAATDSNPESTGAAEGGPSGTIRVWTHQNQSFNDSYQALADAYMAQNPNAKIEFESFEYDNYLQTLQTALPAGTEADVMQMFGSWVCSYSSNLAPLPEEVSSASEAEGVFFAGPLSGYNCDGTLYGLPQESNIEYGAVLVNTEMAAAAGVSLDGWANFDEFIADAKKMSVKNGSALTRAGYHFNSQDGLAYTFLSLILQNNGSYVDDGGVFSFNTPEGKASLDLMKRFVSEGTIDVAAYADNINDIGVCFFTEQCAMGLSGSWLVAEYTTDFPEVVAKAQFVPLPTLQNSTFAADSGWGLTVSKNSASSELAWDFVKFVTADPNNALQWNLGTGTLPAVTANVEGAAREEIVAKAPYVEPFLGILENARFLGNLKDRDQLFYNILKPNILKALTGQSTIDQALIDIEKAANGG
jgi:multiple sugar transport system substrate-binding protein